MSGFDDVLAAWMQADERGRAALLAAHPQHAERLRRFRDNEDWLRNAAAADAATLDGAVVSQEPHRVRYVGDYELLEEIARGGMGVVWKARQISLGRVVALKMVLAGEHAGEDRLRRFRAEAEAAAGLDHPNIVPVYEVGVHGGQPYFSMKLIEGRSLDRAMAAYRGKPREAAVLLAKAARAVHHAHRRGVLHRDLKPGNILLDGDGEPYVADFGLARRGEGGASLSGDIIGTPAYMSPEQARAEKGLTVAADVWSLGAILYEMLAGRPPFQGEGVLDVLAAVVSKEPPRLSGDLGVIAAKCLEKSPGRRYESAAALADDLERWLRGEPILARPAGRLERLGLWASRNPAVASLIATVVVLLVGVTVGAGWVAMRERALRAKAQAETREKQAALEAKDEAVTHADSLRLSALSSALLPDNPTLALLLAVEGAQRGRPRTATHNNALHAALGAVAPHRILRAKDSSASYSSGVRLSPDGRRVLSIRWMRHGPAWIWDLDGDSEPVVLRPPGTGGHFGIADAEFSPDGRRVVTVFEGGRVCRYPDGKSHLHTDRAARVWDAITGEELSVLRGHTDIVRSARFSPDGRRIVTASADGTFRIWDAADGRPLARMEAGKAPPCRAAFTPDGTRVFGYCATERLARHEVRQTGKGGYAEPPVADAIDPLFRREPATGAGPESFTNMHSGPHGSADTEAELRLWEADTGRLVSVRPLGAKGHSVPVSAFVFPPFGEPVLVFPFKMAVSHSFGVGVLTASSVERVRLPERIGDRYVRHVLAFSPDGRLAALVTDHSGTSVTVWDTTRNLAHAVLRGHEGGSIEQAVFSADNTRLVTAAVTGGDTSIRVWPLPPVKSEWVVPVSWGGIGFGQWHPSTGRILAIQGSQSPGTLGSVWDGIRGARLIDLRCPDAVRAHHAALSPDGRRVVACLDRVEGEGDPRWVRVFDAGTGKESYGLAGLPGGVSYAEFSPDGRYLLTESGGGTTKRQKGAAVFDRGNRPSNVDQAVRIWDAATGAMVRTLPHEEGRPVRATWGPNGRLCLVIGARRTTLAVWEATGDKVCDLQGPREGDDGVVFSPDGRRLLTRGKCKSAWDATTGRRLFDFGGDSPVPAYSQYTALRARGRWAAFSPDGLRIVTADGPAGASVPAVWDAQNGRLLLSLRGHRRDVTSVGFSPDGRFVVTASEPESTARVWYADSGIEYRTLPLPSGASRADFSHDGGWILAGGDHASMASAAVTRTALDPLPEALARCPRVLTAEERERFAVPERPRPALPFAPQPPGIKGLQERAEFHADGGWWAKAAADYARAVELDFDDVNALTGLALAAQAAGDGESCRRARAAVPALWERHANFADRLKLAKVCVVGGVDPAATLRRTEIDRGTWGSREHPLGAALYRAGQFDRAIMQLLREMKYPNNAETDAVKSLFLAMALRDRGDAKPAAKWLDRAGQYWKKADRGIGWRARLAYDLLRREAETTVVRLAP